MWGRTIQQNSQEHACIKQERKREVKKGFTEVEVMHGGALKWQSKGDKRERVGETFEAVWFGVMSEGLQSSV